MLVRVVLELDSERMRRPFKQATRRLRISHSLPRSRAQARGAETSETGLNLNLLNKFSSIGSSIEGRLQGYNHPVKASKFASSNATLSLIQFCSNTTLSNSLSRQG
eukprot:3209439-Pleurochrysis_carterae.AAC.2